MITIINEKHSQANDFADALGGYKGTLPADSTFGSEPYEIVYASGHLYVFKDLPDMILNSTKEELSKFTSWDANDLPFNRHLITWNKMLNPHTLGGSAKDYMKRIKDAVSKSDAVVIATDNDPSGEGNLLGWEIVKGSGFSGDVYRCEHDDQSKASILKAFRNLKKVSTDDNSSDRDGLYFKALARSKFDFLTIQYTRMLKYVGNDNQVLQSGYLPRTGRLKAAMLQLIGHQEDLHENFKPHSSYTPALFDEDGHKFLKKDSEYFNTEKEAQDHLAEVPQNATSVEIGTKPLTRKPPLMLNLSKLGARLAKQGYDTKEVYEMAEKMYQSKYLSYPRTEDKVITVEQLNLLKQDAPKIAKLAGIDPNLLDLNNFRKYAIGKGSHGANRPGSNVPNDLNEIEEQFGKTGVALYVLEAKSALSLFAPDEKLERHEYADSETKSYLASATVVTDPGFTKVLNPDSDDKDDKEEDKLFTVGQTLKPGTYEKKASRPSLATLDSLTSFLEHNKIGTGATQLNTYNDIVDKSKKNRQLVKVDKGAKLRLTNLGKVDYLLMANTTLASPKMTHNLEEYLQGIKDKKVTEEQVLSVFDKMFNIDKEKIESNSKYVKALPKYKSLPKASGIFAPTGEKVTFTAGVKNYKFTQQEIDKLLAGKEIEFPFSEDVKMRGRLADRGKYGFGFEGQFVYPKPEMVKGTYKDGQEVEFKRKFSSHTLTDDEVQKVLDGEVIDFNAKSKAGKKYTAHLKLVYGVPYKGTKKTWHLEFANKK